MKFNILQCEYRGRSRVPVKEGDARGILCNGGGVMGFWARAVSSIGASPQNAAHVYGIQKTVSQ